MAQVGVLVEEQTVLSVAHSVSELQHTTMALPLPQLTQPHMKMTEWFGREWKTSQHSSWYHKTIVLYSGRLIGFKL